MRICYYADARYIHAERWMKFFAASGHEMHLISFAEVTDEQVQQLRNAGIKYHGATGNFHIKKFWRTLKDVNFVKSVLRKEKIDILHSHFLGANAWYGALSGFHPHVITIMGGDVVGEDWKPSKNIQERTFTPFALKNADVVTAWSPMLANRVKPFVRPGSKIQITHGGVDLQTFSPGKKSQELRESLGIPVCGRIVFSPRLIRRLYNIDTIAHAAGIVCAEWPNTYFVIATPATILDTEYFDEVQRIFSNSAARDRVRFVPSIAHDKIADHFRLADVTVSIPDTDGTPMAVLESMACGTPTVIGNLPDYDPEYFESEVTTLMADVKDPAAVARSILRFLNDDQLVRQVTEEASRRVEATGIYEYQMAKMEQIYEQLASK